MRCRKLYTDLVKDNYNLVFFKSTGMAFPEEIKISISNGYETDVQTIIDRQTYNEQTETVVEHELSFFNGNLTMTYEMIKDINNIQNTKINDIKFMCQLDLEFTASIFVTNEEDKMIFIIDSISDLGFDQDTDTYYYVKNNKPYIPFKDFGIAIKTNDNYADKQEGVAYDLIQRLSIIKGELWYQINHGLPLLDKVRSGQIYDSVIIRIIMSHPDVTNIVSFSSSIANNHKYKFNATISTIYNENIEIGNTY